MEAKKVKVEEVEVEKAEPVDRKAERKSLEIDEMKKEMVEEEDKGERMDSRNKSAVKSDAATVPTYIWRENLLRMLQDRASASPFALG